LEGRYRVLMGVLSFPLSGGTEEYREKSQIGRRKSKLPLHQSGRSRRISSLSVIDAGYLISRCKIRNGGVELEGLFVCVSEIVM
jgi:hypothetical protein